MTLRVVSPWPPGRVALHGWRSKGNLGAKKRDDVVADLLLAIKERRA